MVKFFSLIALIIVFMSCENHFEAEYYFPKNNNASFYAVIFNSKNGTITRKQKGKSEYHFEKGNIIYAKESPVIGVGKNHYYLLSEGETTRTEIVEEREVVPNNQQIIVYFHTLASYTIAETNKQIDYEMFWLAPNKKRSNREQLEEDKKQNMQIQQLHQKIDSLVNSGIL